MASIVQDPEIRSGSPRIEGTRVTVLDIKRRVIDSGEEPHVVAGEYDISMAVLFRALSYYYDHREAFAERERAFETARSKGEQQTRELIEAIAEAGDGTD